MQSTRKKHQAQTFNDALGGLPELPHRAGLPSKRFYYRLTTPVASAGAAVTGIQYKSKDYFPKRRTNTAFLNKQDPCHASACVTEQLKNNNGGFVSNYAGTYPNDAEVDLVMNYYNGATLKVYDLSYEVRSLFLLRPA